MILTPAPALHDNKRPTTVALAAVCPFLGSVIICIITLLSIGIKCNATFHYWALSWLSLLNNDKIIIVMTCQHIPTMVPVMVQQCFCGYWFLRKRMLKTMITMMLMITMMIIWSHSHLVRAQLGAGHNSSASWPPCTLGSKHWSDHQNLFQFSF